MTPLRPRPVVHLSVVAATSIFAGALLLAAGQQVPTSRPTTPPAASRSTAPSSAPEPVDYNWDVRPILSENCFLCHGPSETGRRAGLRLDDPDGATKILNERTGHRA